jgi:hypothetical protein
MIWCVSGIDSVTLIPRSAVTPALEPTLLIDIWSPDERSRKGQTVSQTFS